MGKLEVHDDEGGRDRACFRQCIAAVAHRMRAIAMGVEQVAKEAKVEFIVLDHQYGLAHDFPLSPLASAARLGESARGHNCLPRKGISKCRKRTKRSRSELPAGSWPTNNAPRSEEPTTEIPAQRHT